MKPLSRKTRFKLVIASLFIFIVLVPMVLANSFGYKFNSLGDVLTLIKTGGIYIHSDTSNTSIYIDGEYYKDSGRLLRNTLIQDLIPNRDYEVVVNKEGFHEWKKILRVAPSLVTEVSTLMLPLEIETREIYPFFDIAGLGTTTPPTTLSINTITGKIIPTNQEYIELMNIFTGEDFYGLETVITNQATTTTDSSSSTDPLFEYFLDIGIEDYEDLNNFRIVRDQAVWIEGGDIRIRWTDENDLPYYYFCIKSEECSEEITIDLDSNIEEFEFMPGRDDVLIVLTSGGVYAIEIDDRSDRNIQPVYIGEELELGLSESDRIVVKDGEIFHELNI